jgi:hypothetical protein
MQTDSSFVGFFYSVWRGFYIHVLLLSRGSIQKPVCGGIRRVWNNLERHKMLQKDLRMAILLLSLLVGTANCSLKPAVTFQNSLAGINPLQDAPSSNIPQEVVEKLGDIAKILKDGYQGVRS